MDAEPKGNADAEPMDMNEVLTLRAAVGSQLKALSRYPRRARKGMFVAIVERAVMLAMKYAKLEKADVRDVLLDAAGKLAPPTPPIDRPALFGDGD